MTILQVEDLTRRFDGLVALDSVSFTAAEGGITAVIGPNGAGKTTLFNVIAGALPPTAGRVRFAGQDRAGSPPHRMAALGLVRTFQLVRPFPAMTLAENVRTGAHLRTRGGPLAALIGQPRQEREVAARALHLLDRVGLAAAARRTPGTLAYGQLRLLEIARALAAGPRLLLLDEPAAGLDPAETDALAVLLRSIRDEGVSLLLIEHDMRLVMDLAEHVVVLDFGRTIASGPPHQVTADPAVQSAYLGGAE